MEQKYYLGIDGGGTKTAFVVIDSNSNIVYESISSPTSIDTIPFEMTKKVIEDECQKIPYKVDAIFAGLGGMNSKQDIENINAFLKSLPILILNGKVDSGSDVINALYGALNGKNGIVLIAGTGSVAYGKNDNKFARSGGYCYQEGDPGSAYYLGYRALQYLARVLDGRKDETEFSKAIKKAIQYKDFKSIVNSFTKMNRTQIASLSPIVTMYQNEPEAYQIIKDGVKEVLEMIKAVYKRLQFTNSCNFSIIGSLGNADTMYKELLLYGLKQISSSIKYVEKINEASYGAALKAKEL